MNSEGRTAVAPQNYGELEIREEDGFLPGLLKRPVFLAAVYHACPGARWGPEEQMMGVVILSPHPVPPTRTDAFPDKTCFHTQAPAQASRHQELQLLDQLELEETARGTQLLGFKVPSLSIDLGLQVKHLEEVNTVKIEKIYRCRHAFTHRTPAPPTVLHRGTKGTTMTWQERQPPLDETPSHIPLPISPSAQHGSRAQQLL
ncbi:Mucin-16 [Manis pentadactyla]|nr:Mucin-16 [Manis pentadactyla]